MYLNIQSKIKKSLLQYELIYWLKDSFGDYYLMLNAYKTKDMTSDYVWLNLLDAKFLKAI